MLKLKRWVERELPPLERERLALDLNSLAADALSGDQRFHVTRIMHALCEKTSHVQPDEEDDL